MDIPRFIHDVYSGWIKDKVPQHGASLAFYAALSLAPMLVILLMITATVFGENAARGEVAGQLRGLVGEEAGSAIESMIQNADRPGSGWTATILSSCALLFGASGVFAQLQESLNTIWNVVPQPSQSLWKQIRYRLLSFGLVMGSAFLLLVLVLFTTALNLMGQTGLQSSGIVQGLFQLLNFAVSVGVISVLFALMFKLLPDATIAWSDVWIGAIVTSVLFSFGKIGIGLYLSHSSFASSYGVAGSFVVLLVWIYYSAQILYLGAELTQVYANQYGSKIVSSRPAKTGAIDTSKNRSPAC